MPGHSGVPCLQPGAGIIDSPWSICPLCPSQGLALRLWEGLLLEKITGNAPLVQFGKLRPKASWELALELFLKALLVPLAFKCGHIG